MNSHINDHADFDIWAKVDENASLAVAEWLAERLYVSKMDAYKAVAVSVKSGRYVRIFAGYGWKDLPRLVENLPVFVRAGTAVFAEQDCSPDYEKVEYCELHRLYHYPATLCPVCSGNYIHEGHRE